MQLGMIGLGRMGANMSRRLMRAGHELVVHDRAADAIDTLVGDGAHAAATLADFADRLAPPRAVWLMVPASVVDATIDALAPHLAAGDVILDGGNSQYEDDVRRARALGDRGIDYLDVGTSGGVWGLERGYCLMIGGPEAVAARLAPIFAALAPGVNAAPRLTGRAGEPSAAEHGYLYCGGPGAGHFVKMVHNAIEYGVMAAYAEGFNLLHRAAGPVEDLYGGGGVPRYDFDLPAIAEVWRRGSVIGSWLLDLTATALAESPALEGFQGRVGDSGEGRWTARTALDRAVPMPVLSAALIARFTSRNEDEFANRLLSAMRHQFGGHAEHD